MNAMSLPADISPEPYQVVLVGTDFTPCSAAAVSQALRIAAWSGARLYAVHVIDTTVVIELETVLSDFQRATRASLADAAMSAWHHFAAAIPGAADIPVKIEINNRVAGVLESARTSQADLLVLGAFGERRPDVGFGTLATACVRESATDVLLVRDTQTGAFRTIVVGVDFSETSMKALRRAATVAAREGAVLHALHLFEPPWQQVHYRSPEPVAPAAKQREYRRRLESLLSEFTQPVIASHPDLKLLAVCDDSGTNRLGIAHYATKVGADLTVLGTRGRTNLRDLLLGSTAERVLAESRCSVLAVKPAASHH